MEPLFLNFPTFYHSAIKGNTNLSQFNAVSVLLLGKVREKCTNEAIDDPSVSVYVSGKKPIRKSILTPLLSISHKEIIGRLNMLGIQDIQRMVDALTKLIDQVANLSDTAKAPLLKLARTAGSEYDFVAETFLVAIKCPTEFRRRLSDETTQYLNLLGWPERATSMLEPPTSAEKERDPKSEPADDTASPEEQKKKTRIPVEFSQEAQKVFVSFRDLSIPEDKEAAISYFQGTCDDSFLILDRADVESFISGPDGSCYSLVDVIGDYKSTCTELSRWKKFSNCGACILKIEMSVEDGLEMINEVLSCVQGLIQEDAAIIVGSKFVTDLAAQEVRIHFILRMQTSSPEKVVDGGLGSLETHRASEEPEDADPFDDIFRIFNPQYEQTQDASPKSSSTEKNGSLDEEADPFDDIFKIFNKKYHS